MLHGIALVDMWWNKLIGELVFRDSLAESGVDLIVEYVCDRA